jgi:hypothetical protein
VFAKEVMGDCIGALEIGQVASPASKRKASGFAWADQRRIFAQIEQLHLPVPRSMSKSASNRTAPQ